MKSKQIPMFMLLLFFTIFYIPPLHADNIKIIPDFMVNENPGIHLHENPAIGADQNGNFVIVWEDKRNGKMDIYGQRFNSNGVKLGPNFRINDDGHNRDHKAPAIAVSPQGFVIVVWKDYRVRWTKPDIYCQIFDPNGIRQGNNFKINDHSGGTHHPAVDTDPMGNFVVTWEEYNDVEYDIYAQRCNRDGTKIGLNFKVNRDYGRSNHEDPAVSVNQDGSFIIVWRDNRNGKFEIFGQRYDSQGNRLSTNFKIREDVNGTRYYPDVAADTQGNFVIIWRNHLSWNYDIYGQRYDRFGNTLGTNFRINDDTGQSEQYEPVIAMDSDGNFIVVWPDNRGTIKQNYAQLFSATGAPIGKNYQISVVSQNTSNAPAVKFCNGFIYHAWQSKSIYSQHHDIFACVSCLTKPNSPPEAPTLVYPANNTYMANQFFLFNIPADLDQDLLHFRVEIANDPNFMFNIAGSPFESQVNTSYFQPTPPLMPGSGSCFFLLPYAIPNGTYWWRVSAFDGQAYGYSSSVWKFTVTPGTKSFAGTDLSKSAVENMDIPDKFRLSGAFPNPFNQSTLLQYDLPEASEVDITIYNLLGRIIYRHRLAQQSPGYHTFSWSGLNDLQQQVPSGLYIINFQTRYDVMNRKVLLIR